MLKGTMLGINGLQILSKALLAFKILAKMNSVSDVDTDVTDLVLFVSSVDGLGDWLNCRSVQCEGEGLCDSFPI